MDFKQRRGTSAEWAAANPVLPDGVIGFDRTAGNIKVGNGVSTWSQLGWAGGGGSFPAILRIHGGDATLLSGYVVTSDGTVLDSGYTPPPDPDPEPGNDTWVAGQTNFVFTGEAYTPAPGFAF